MRQVKNKQLEFIIRKATSLDASKILEHVKKVGDETSFLTFSGSEFNKTIKEEIKIIEDHNNSENQIFFIAEHNDKVIGVSNLMASQKNRLRHIGEFGISVTKDYWGKGVGKSMITYLIDWAKQNKVLTKINLVVQVDNVRAFELYKKLGFIIEGRTTRALKVNGKYSDAFYMGLEL